MSNKNTYVQFSRRLTGYDREDTAFEIIRKSEGTDPNITVGQMGQWSGKLILDERAAEELARTLLYIIGKEK